MPRERLLRAVVLPAGEGLRPARRRIDRHERLREDDELGAVAGGLRGERLEPVERRLAVEDDGLGLHAGDGDGAVHGSRLARVTTLVLKLVLTPSVMVGATLAGRRWGGAVSGWLVGFPLTSGPLVLYLALDHGRRFAAHTAVGSLSGAIAEVAFCLGYGLGARRGWRVARRRRVSRLRVCRRARCRRCRSASACRCCRCSPRSSLALAAGLLLLPRPAERAPTSVRTPRWDLAARAAVATGLVLALAALAPTIGARLTGLLAVYPLYSAVLAVFAHRLQGQAAAHRAAARAARRAVLVRRLLRRAAGAARARKHRGRLRLRDSRRARRAGGLRG